MGFKAHTHFCIRQLKVIVVCGWNVQISGRSLNKAVVNVLNPHISLNNEATGRTLLLTPEERIPRVLFPGSTACVQFTPDRGRKWTLSGECESWKETSLCLVGILLKNYVYFNAPFLAGNSVNLFKGLSTFLA